MYQYLILGGILGAQYVYHRWFEDHPKPPPAKELSLPRTDEGAPIPLVYGRCMIRSPILAWSGVPSALRNPVYADESSPDFSNLDGQTYWQGADYLYYFEAMYILGIPFSGINSDNSVLAIYAGERQIPDIGSTSSPSNPIWTALPYVPLSELQGNGGFESDTRPCAANAHVDIAANEGSTFEIGGLVEFLNGQTDQQLVNPTTPFAATTVAGERMSLTIDPSKIPGYRGYMCLFLGGRDDLRWGIGSTPQVQSYRIECSSYPASWSFGVNVGVEANPAGVIYDLLTGSFGKLGLSTSLVDSVTFAAAADTLADEDHGYSRAIENPGSADEIIMEILKQIDAVLFEDPTDGKIKLKLIRGDYVPADCLLVTPENCRSLESPAAGGWTGRVNKIRLGFTRRATGYTDGSATAQNQANAVGQDGIVVPLEIQMPGVCTQELADQLAARELAALSRPIFKCSAIVDRSFLRINPGDVVALTWPDWHISGMLMRVAGVTRGSLQDGAIKLDLLQDFFFARRGALVEGGDHGTIGSFPGTALIG